MPNVNPNLADINAATKAAAAGTTIGIKPGTLVLDRAAIQLITANNLSFVANGDVTIRAVLHPFATKIDTNRIAGMAAMGFSGSWRSLSKDQQDAVTAWLNTKPAPDTGVARTAVNSFLATLSPVRDSRMLDANPTRVGEITLNGKSYTFAVHWTAGLAKGIFTVKIGVWGSYFRGFKFQNASGGSSNGAAIRTQQRSDVFTDACTFEDCDDGVLAGGWQAIPNASGDWYNENPAIGRQTVYGANVDRNCVYDGCGSPTGLAHGFYGGNCLLNLSVGAKAVRSNGGHYRKYNGGLQIMIGGDLQDDGTLKGLEQAGDFDAGACYVINTKATKNSGGNDGAVILCRNGREPIPSWFENVLGVFGCVITDTHMHVGAAVRALDEMSFVKAAGAKSIYPGVPTPIRAVIKGNVIRLPARSPLLKTPIVAPPGSVITPNQIIGMDDAYSDPTIPLPSYTWNRKTMFQEAADLLSKVDPENTFAAKLFSLPTYPPGVVINFPEAA